jgi:hypothetical protein
VEDVLHGVARTAQLLIESMAVIVVAFGAIEGFVRLLGDFVEQDLEHSLAEAP